MLADFDLPGYDLVGVDQLSYPHQRIGYDLCGVEKLDYYWKMRVKVCQIYVVDHSVASESSYAPELGDTFDLVLAAQTVKDLVCH